VFAPLALPILPVETFLRYQRALGISPPRTEVGHVGPLPQHFGDMFGWPEMVEQVARVYHALPVEDRQKAAIFAGNYGEAAAIARRAW
jgi:DNA-binding helix-hairpin-helix protein with protein kinase domain